MLHFIIVYIFSYIFTFKLTNKCSYIYSMTGWRVVPPKHLLGFDSLVASGLLDKIYPGPFIGVKMFTVRPKV
jgi:hypothetical protein